ncbi:NAD(P)-dependent oxidoreductase [Nevskia sp.]|uniref:NAD-dependent epimerase/dehydratase family protein n=1 Tax=Nevskia sp. TaxID=1929292 RepID=UPI0025F97EC6|nr:NAD-dependent epimerase/dehydratase family protein [Nevskia sp.]
MSRRSVIVLGAGGFIGRRIVAALAASDWAVPVAGVRSPQPGAGASEQRQVDATSEASLRAALADADGIVNCIAGAADTITANARALAAVLPQLARAPRVVHLSSMAVYGSAVGRVDEDAPLLGDLDAYGAAKVAAERLLAPLPNLSILRPGIVYGPASLQWSGLLGDLLLARRLGALGAAGNGCCNLVHVDDLAAAVRLALETPVAAGRAYNLGVDDAPTWNGYFQHYGEALGVTPPSTISTLRLQLELKLIGPLLKVGELAVGAGRLPPPIRPWLTRLCRHDLRLDGRRAATELGVVHRPVATGLREAAAWHRSGYPRAAARPA